MQTTIHKAKKNLGLDANGYRVTLELTIEEHTNEEHKRNIHLEPMPKYRTLSLSGYARWRPHQDISYGGQIQDHLRGRFRALAISRSKLNRILEIWDEWHLNDMSASCVHQREEGWNKIPIDNTRPHDVYVTLKAGEHGMLKNYSGWNMLAWVRPEDHPLGLLTRACQKCGYKYGSAWLVNPLPAEIEKEILQIFGIAS